MNKAVNYEENAMNIIPVGNYFDKYNNQNFIVRKIMKGFFSSMDVMLSKVDLNNVLEVGCGEGIISDYIYNRSENIQLDAFDITEEIIEAAKNTFFNINFFVDNIYNMKYTKDRYDVVMAIEVLEHLENPKLALKNLLDKAEEYVLVSVPREPIWRLLNMCRGKYLLKLGNTPGHIQHWSKRQFVELCNQSGGEIVAVFNPIPWTMVLIKKNKLYKTVM